MDNAFHDGSRSTVYAGPLMTDQPMNMGQAAAPQALLLLGPTASGKSALALQLARLLPVEIISIDSALVYRGMDIGSAKPTSAELQAAPHHLIDIRAINEPYSAADFVADASRLVREIRARGRLPLIVGGTMLYAKAIREGIAAPLLQKALPRGGLRCTRSSPRLIRPLQNDWLQMINSGSAALWKSFA